MSFIHETQSRKFLLFLILFIMVIAGSALFTYQQQKTALKDIKLLHDYATASALVEQKIPADKAAAVLTNATITAAGKKIAAQIGISEHTDLRFLPILRSKQADFARMLTLQTLALSVLLLIGSILFLWKREKLYLLAIQRINRFVDGDFSAHLPRTGEGTLYRLFAAVDSLSSALQAKSEAEHNARRFLRETISDISHQLKTPLSALNMYNEIIAGEADNPSAVAEFSKKTSQSLSRMESLIGAMLKIARLDTGSISFEKEWHSASELVEKSIEQLRLRAEQEGKRLSFSGPSQTILCDLEWTSEAITNIVKNALDHTGPEGQIDITWERSQTMLRLFIADNGPGIRPEDFHHIFKRFYRSKSSLDTPGIGLGLPLAKAIIEGQGGLISVQSAPGKGTVFTLSFLTDL
ncbi:MAG: HAMP domain-containing sensor histidine kinase [Clostridiales Family XIII bacterium]|nr:HAMP domain-containing histidine kinase [Clostridia bacterium]MDE8734166.1 HAMP domain-containing sensor histidine kinase [Eubacteriales bacterium DFI.9.88]MDY3010740.1 HAMP domain-containing sensor histidine kinase [Clostridiales Family XIII bacterium]